MENFCGIAQAGEQVGRTMVLSGVGPGRTKGIWGIQHKEVEKIWNICYKDWRNEWPGKAWQYSRASLRPQLTVVTSYQWWPF